MSVLGVEELGTECSIEDSNSSERGESGLDVSAVDVEYLDFGFAHTGVYTPDGLGVNRTMEFSA